MTSASVDSTTAMRMPCASTWLEATAARASRATRETGQFAKVKPLNSPHRHHHFQMPRCFCRARSDPVILNLPL